jgi:phospholipase/carboxylesterase
MSSLIHLERPAAAEPVGLLVLHHGRGADERDLLSLANVLDPGRVLHVVSARGPLRLPGWNGYHWYQVPRVGIPDPETFHSSYDALANFHEDLWLRTGLTPAQTVLGGFSMGAVMSYALSLGSGRPVVAGLLAFSGFVPAVEGWNADLESRQATRAFIAHGRQDGVIDVSFAHRARTLLESGGLDVDYHESSVDHQIDRDILPTATDWLARTLGLGLG